jgi:hypothetical protein
MMANDDTPAGFLSRWSRRKAQVSEGRALEEPVLLPAASVPAAVPAAPAHSPLSQSPDLQEQSQVASPTDAPAPTLRDVQQLTPESDYASFMHREVAPDVKNAAMKKLFSDPHFNVMDRMDVYIDDYSQPDPLPAAMLRQMASAKFMNLFDDDLEASAAVNPGDPSAAQGNQVVAQSVPAKNNSNPEPSTHDHADLRLQPDPASRPEGPGSKPV